MYRQLIFSSILAIALFAVALNILPVQAQGGQTYIVEPGDTLSQLAEEFYGDPFAWNVIVDATNNMAEDDSSFTMIADVNLIEVGQKLQIPAPFVPGEVAAEPGDNIPPEFLAALQDAATAEPDEISQDLIAITQANEELMWQDGKVRVSTWAHNHKTYATRTQLAETEQVWVTAVPELQAFCTNL